MRRLIDVKRVAGWGLCACLLGPLAATGDEPPAGLFSKPKIAVAPPPGIGAERGTMRSRVVQIDTKQIAAARRGRETLKLNLFDDAVFEVRVERVQPTRSGYYLSGRAVGEVTTPKGTYTIRPERSAGRSMIRQIDPSTLGPDTKPSISSRGALPQLQTGVDDGSQIDLLVVYTAAARNERSGTAAVEANARAYQ